MNHKEFLKHYHSDGSQKTPISEYPREFIAGMKKVVDGSFSNDMVSKSKYTVRGSLIGLVVGAGTAMYFKKSVFFFSLVGVIGGIITGHLVGAYIANKGLNSKTNTKEDEVTEPTT